MYHHITTTSSQELPLAEQERSLYTSSPAPPFLSSSTSSFDGSDSLLPNNSDSDMSTTPPSSPPPLFSCSKIRSASTPTRLPHATISNDSPSIASSPPVIPLKSHCRSGMLSERIRRYENWGASSATGRDGCEKNNGLGNDKVNGRVGRQGQTQRQGQEQGGKEAVDPSMYAPYGGFYTIHANSTENTVGLSPSTVAGPSLHPNGVPAPRSWSFVEGVSDQVSMAEPLPSTHIDASKWPSYGCQMSAQRESERQRRSEKNRARITRQEMDEAHSYWPAVMAQMDEVADGVMSEDENDSSYSKESSTFSMPGVNVENIEYITSSHPSSLTVTGILYNNVYALNRERYQRTICVDDPDSLLVDMRSTRKEEEAVKEEDKEEVPWLEMLQRQLPSPSVFTPCTYRSKHHTVDQVERAVACLGVGLQDYALTARALQCRENRTILGAALSSCRQRLASPSTYSFRVGMMTLGNMKSQYGEYVQLNLVVQWELRRDIERLVGLQRNIKEARTRLTEYPLLSKYSIRQSKIQYMPHPECSTMSTMESESNSLLMGTMMRSVTHVQRARSVNWTRERPFGVSDSYVTSLRSSSSQLYLPDNRPPYPPNRQSRPPSRRQSSSLLNLQSGPSVASPNPSSVYGNVELTVRDTANMQCPPTVRSRLASIEDRNRAAAKDIVLGLGSVSIHRVV